MKWAAEIAENYFDLIGERLHGGNENYVKTGISSIDKAFPALLHNGHLIILAARPSMGKTALAAQISEYISQEKTTAFFTLEMSNYELAERGICKRAGVPVSAVKTLDGNDKPLVEALFAAQGEFSCLNLLIDDGSYSIHEIVGKSKALPGGLAKAEKPPLGLIVVDYIQLVDGGKAANRNLELGQISRALKRLAQELKVPVLALSQLNRSLESRNNKRPIMSDLRESGNLEQDADFIGAIYRDEVYDPDSQDAGTAEFIGLKNRHGGISTVKTAFIGEKLTFANLAWDHAETKQKGKGHGNGSENHGKKGRQYESKL